MVPFNHGMHAALNWLYWHFGVNGTGAYYGFWSGTGSDLGEYTVAGAIVGGIVTAIHTNNCEVHGCWRLKRHVTAGGHRVCRIHHPEGAPSAQDVIDAHEAGKACTSTGPVSSDPSSSQQSDSVSSG